MTPNSTVPPPEGDQPPRSLATGPVPPARRRLGAVLLLNAAVPVAAAFALTGVPQNTAASIASPASATHVDASLSADQVFSPAAKLINAGELLNTVALPRTVHSPKQPPGAGD